MDSSVLEHLLDQMRDELHPRAKEIYNFLGGFFLREDCRIQCSGFVKEASKCMTSSEAKKVFDWLTGSAEYLILTPGSTRKFRTNPRCRLTMTALNNAIKDLGFRDTHVQREHFVVPVVKQSTKTIYKVISISDFDTNELKAELAKRERKVAEERALNEKRTRLLTINKRLLIAANAIGFHTKENLINLVNEALKLETEVKDRWWASETLAKRCPSRRKLSTWV